jgi:hypothetical protein
MIAFVRHYAVGFGNRRFYFDKTALCRNLLFFFLANERIFREEKPMIRSVSTRYGRILEMGMTRCHSESGF